jgi:hypothetical protein
MRHVLVVANQTLAGKELMAALREKVRQEPTDIWVVVPATAPAEDHALLASGPNLGVTPGTRDVGMHPDAFEIAQRRLEKGLSLISGLGVRVEGEVGDSDPVQAVDDVLGRLSFDEVIVSTLPHPVSHWMRSDLPAKIHRKHHLPVTTVTAHTFVDG